MHPVLANLARRSFTKVTGIKTRSMQSNLKLGDEVIYNHLATTVTPVWLEIEQSSYAIKHLRKITREILAPPRVEAGIVFLILSLCLPFLSLSRSGVSSSMSVLDAVTALWASDMRWLGLLSLALIALLPTLRLILLAYVMTRLRYRLGIIPSMLSAMRWAERLEPWAMAEIFMVGVVVSLVKISDLATLSVGPAFWALLGLIITTSLISIFFCKDSVWQLLTTRSA